MKDQLINRPKGTDGKAILGSDNTTALNQLEKVALNDLDKDKICLLYTSPSPRDRQKSRMPSSA